MSRVQDSDCEGEAMNLREHAELKYAVDGNGTIRSPGKFEGEPWWVPTAWDITMDGCCDELDAGSVFEPDEQEREDWGVSGEPSHLLLTESNQGFVSHTWITAEQFDSLLRGGE